MFATGVLFWLQFIPSPPFHRRMPLLSQAGALLGTNVIMIGMAMTLSIFVTGSVYPVYDHIPGVALPGVRGPADRRGDLVGLRGLLGPPGDGRDRQADGGHRGEHEHRAGQDAQPGVRPVGFVGRSRPRSGALAEFSSPAFFARRGTVIRTPPVRPAGTGHVQRPGPGCPVSPAHRIMLV